MLKRYFERRAAKKVASLYKKLTQAGDVGPTYSLCVVDDVLKKIKLSSKYHYLAYARYLNEDDFNRLNSEQRNDLSYKGARGALLNLLFERINGNTSNKGEVKKSEFYESGAGFDGVFVD
ncbi:hypothetical protein [Kordiimonas laminariae]|uniref:hypothetical protein n=1 Tax=Kordiimonas laminariae TaxID=2917717 RepID=UPI001FF2F872|nr:hypothetical protein [Kordiimonas laminariae]MCK0068761.1 hypothetical protein [Kordiimonas laminariae]